jgi:membrane protease YdiL (CAAX protease family)
MVEKKPLFWFLLITILISWPLFLTPLIFPGLGLGLWTAAMWGPGIAALIATVFVAKKGGKEGLKELGLGRFGKFRFCLFAWFLPPVAVVLTILLTVLLGLGRFDPDFSVMRQVLAASGGAGASPQAAILAQILQGLFLGPVVNVLFTLGEELGWRGFLLPRLLPLGRWPAILVSGAIWGVWHAPAVVLGLNYPGHPVVGVPMMIGFCILLGAFLSWLYLETRSPWVAALAHGSLNAWGNLPIVFLVPGFNLLLAGTVPSLTGWLVLAALAGVLILAKRLPGKDEVPSR